MVESLFLVFLVSCQLLFGAFAIKRMHATRSAEGYSLMGQGFLLGTVPGWLILPFLVDTPVLAINYITWASVFAVTLWFILRYTTRAAAWRPVVTWGLVSALMTVGVAATAGAWGAGLATTLGVMLAVADFLYGIPSLHSGLASPTTTGLSVGALLVKVTVSLVHTVAGLGVGFLSPVGEVVWGYLIYGIGSLAYTLPVLGRVLWRRSRGLDTSTTLTP